MGCVLDGHSKNLKNSKILGFEDYGIDWGIEIYLYIYIYIYIYIYTHIYIHLHGFVLICPKPGMLHVMRQIHEEYI